MMARMSMSQILHAFSSTMGIFGVGFWTSLYISFVGAEGAVQFAAFFSSGCSQRKRKCPFSRMDGGFEFSASPAFHEYGRRVGMVPRSSLKKEKQSNGGENNKNHNHNPKTTTKDPQAESPPSRSLSSVLSETGETKKSV